MVWLHRAVDVNEKIVKADYNEQFFQLNLDRSKPYRFEEEIQVAMTDEDHIADLDLRKHAKEHVRENRIDIATNFWDIHVNGHDNLTMFLVHILNLGNSRAKQDDFVIAKQKEVKEPKGQDVWTLVRSDTLPEDANMFGERFVHTLKLFFTPDEINSERKIFRRETP